MIDINKSKKHIRDQCKQAGVTRQQVAKYCGVSVQAVNKWWYGYGLPSIDNLVLLTELFDCKLDDLIVSTLRTIDK